MSKRLPEKLTAPEVELLSPMLKREGDRWTADFRGLTLRTALQPIYSISHKRIVGYEALIRAFDILKDLREFNKGPVITLIYR